MYASVHRFPTCWTFFCPTLQSFRKVHVYTQTANCFIYAFVLFHLCDVMQMTTFWRIYFWNVGVGLQKWISLRYVILCYIVRVIIVPHMYIVCYSLVLAEHCSRVGVR